MNDIMYEFFEPVHGHRATMVMAVAYIGGETIEVTGEALRHPDDKNDKELATLLANSRALKSLSKKLEKRANGLVRHNDHVAAMKKRQTKNPGLREPRIRKGSSV